MDDDCVEREYLVTEGYLWTGQYPECQRCVEGEGNNQSMELDEETINAHWSKDGNGEPKFFIINEAIISKLCTLGEANEPCFEGAHIGVPTIQFAFEDGFKEQLFSMMNELKELMNKGGEKVFTRYAVEIGDALWTALYSHVEGTYGIESVCEDGEQKFAVLLRDFHRDGLLGNPYYMEAEYIHWSMPKSDTIVSKIEEYAVGGDIILFHDSVSRRDPQTLQALKMVIPVLKDRGFQFVTVSELIDTASCSAQ